MEKIFSGEILLNVRYFINKWGTKFKITQSHKKNKGRELFRRPLCSYVFWGAESEFKGKIAPYPISFGDNLKKRVIFENTMEKYGMIMNFKPLSSITKKD